MFTKDFERKPTSAQIAAVLTQAREEGYSLAEVTRGESGYQYHLNRVSNQWQFYCAPGGGHTITHTCAMKALTIANGAR
jgi:hypothetical protein